jgi:iron complex transport system substrate-binding protein
MPTVRLFDHTRTALFASLLLAAATTAACAAPPSAPPTTSATAAARAVDVSPISSPVGSPQPAAAASSPAPPPASSPVAAGAVGSPSAATPSGAAPPPATAPSKPATAPAAPSPSPGAAAAPAAPTFPLSLTDDLGRSVSLATAPRRIVTLQPSVTEIACAVDACPRVIATDDFSDYPVEVVNRPKLGSMNMSAEGVIAQQPELVLADASTRADLIDQLGRAGVQVLVSEAKTFDDVLGNIELIGRALGTDDAAARVVANMRTRLEAVRSRTNTISRRPRVLHELDATDPNRPFMVGPRTFIDELITLAGGTNALANSPVSFPQVSTEQVVAADPEIITLGDAAFGVSPADVAARPGWANVTAVKNMAIYPVDTNLVSRPGPRLVDALEEFAHIIHPELFP